MKTMLIATALAAAAVLACSGDGGGGAAGTGGQGRENPSGGGGQSEQVCSTDADCPAGSGCTAGGAACVQFTPASTRFAVLVDPGEETGLIPDQFASLEVGAGGTVNVTIPEPLTVWGVVALQPGHGNDPVDGAPQQADEGSARVSGRLVATAPGLIAGTQFRSEAVVKPQGDEPGAPTYAMKVLAGHVYDVAFLPDDPAIPPFYLSALFQAGRFDILLPDPSEYTTVTGQVVRGDPVREPVPAARVTATVDQPLSQKTVQGTAITGADGRFSIVVTGQGMIRVRVEPTKDSPLFDPVEFETDQEGQLGTTKVVREVGELNVGPVLPLRNVAVQVLDQAATSPVRLAMVQVTTAGGATRSAHTGADGVATFQIPDGAYRVAAMPPAGSEVASGWAPLVVGGDMNTQLTLPPRIIVAGRVVRQSTGAGVARAVVTAVTNRVKNLPEETSALHDVSFDTVTEADGSFILRVDPGRYALTVVPPEDSGLGRYAHPDVRLGQGNWLLTVPLPEGTFVRGQVFRQATDPETGTQEAVPVPGAQVQFFFWVSPVAMETIWSLKEDASFAAMVQLAGASVADGAGRFGAVVPWIDAGRAGGDEGWSPAAGAGDWATPGENGGYSGDPDDMDGDPAGAGAFGLPDLDLDPA